ncbi:HD domain-containing protein [Tolumonas lignilytica]|jgi:Predicted HD superfamily hydrolase|uniref:HD domain-containing protein n=1 Tax=Tolumonas lignilytica TaxID=1283284 RepID=UPI0004B84A7C|nr:HD domain-containing protein [Tolumonas lignilytica]
MTDMQITHENPILFWQQQLENWLEQHHTETDGAHDIAHFRRVWKTARALNQAEGGQGDELVLLAAAYLHDIVSLPKNHPERHLSSRLAAREAAVILLELGFPQKKINAVAHAIETHSFSANLPAETWEAKLLQDADRMEALGAIGLARVFYTSGRMERDMFDPYDPLAKHRQLDDMQFALDHFFVKLYKVADGMQTQAGRDMAKQRRKYLEGYVKQLLTEL